MPPACGALRCMSLAASSLSLAFSKRAMIWPATPLATASGLMMVRVRWTAIADGSLPFLAHHAGDGRAHVGGALDGGDAGGFHRGHLLCRRPFTSGDDGAGVAHPTAGRRGLAADEADHRPGGVGLD